jgi:hypothetical protein
METVRVHTLYPPFGCNRNNKTKRSNKVEKKGVLSSMIDARLDTFRHGKNSDARSAFEAMIIAPIFEAWSSKRFPMTLPGFDADKKHINGNALYKYLLKSDRLHMGDGFLVSHVDYAGDSFSVIQYEKTTGLKEGFQKIGKSKTKGEKK